MASLCGTQEKNSGNMAVSDTMDVEKITDKSDHCGKITGIDGSGRGVDADNADTVTEENLAQHISNAKNAVKETADDRCHHRSHRSGHGWQQLLCDSKW